RQYHEPHGCHSLYAAGRQRPYYYFSPTFSEKQMITPIPSSATVLHFGVGNFHCSHQAYAMQRLRELDPEAYCHWRVIGVSLMPSDLPIIAQLQKQHSTYHLKMGSPDRSEELYKIDTLACVLR